MKVGKNKQGVIYWTDYIDGKRIKRESKDWKTQREAKEHHKQFIDSLKHNQHQLHNISYEELLKLYIDHISLSRKKSTVSGLENQLRNVVGEYFVNVKIKKIDAMAIQRFQEEILNVHIKQNNETKQYSNAYLYKLQTSLKNMLDFAFRFRYIEQNPFDLVPLVKRRSYEKKKEMTILTRDEYNAFESIIDDQVYKTLFSVLYWCGLRIGELMALRISDYDIKNKSLHVYKTYDSKNRVITTTKTDSDRFVSVPNICSKEIEILIEEYKNTSGSKYDSESFLFQYDGIIPKTTLDRTKNKLIEKVQSEHEKNVPYFTFHELRHTHVSTLIDLDMKPKDIADRLGHSVEMVNNTYSHLFPERRDVLLDKLNEISNL